MTWLRAEFPGEVVASAEALTGSSTLSGHRVQDHNPPGSEVGPGAIATQGRATVGRADAFGFLFEWEGRSSKHIPLDWTGPDGAEMRGQGSH